jgi:hypothetical protein
MRSVTYQPSLTRIAGVRNEDMVLERKFELLEGFVCRKGCGDKYRDVESTLKCRYVLSLIEMFRTVSS